jgi:hypothetical protein
LTVVCPLLGSWTSRDCPEIEAMVPKAPGTVDGVGVDDGAAVVAEVELA